MLTNLERKPKQYFYQYPKSAEEYLSYLNERYEKILADYPDEQNDASQTTIARLPGAREWQLANIYFDLKRAYSTIYKLNKSENEELHDKFNKLWEKLFRDLSAFYKTPESSGLNINEFNALFSMDIARNVAVESEGEKNVHRLDNENNEKETFRIHFTNGKVKDFYNQTVTTTKNKPGELHEYIFVIGFYDGSIYFNSKSAHQKACLSDELKFNHSSFLSGQPVICGGTLAIDKEGKITEITNKSGHYKPDSRQMLLAVQQLYESGADLNNTKVTIINDKNEEMTCDALLFLQANYSKALCNQSIAKAWQDFRTFRKDDMEIAKYTGPYQLEFRDLKYENLEELIDGTKQQIDSLQVPVQEKTYRQQAMIDVLAEKFPDGKDSILAHAKKLNISTEFITTRPIPPPVPTFEHNWDEEVEKIKEFLKFQEQQLDNNKNKNKNKNDKHYESKKTFLKFALDELNDNKKLPEDRLSNLIKEGYRKARKHENDEFYQLFGSHKLFIEAENYAIQKYHMEQSPLSDTSVETQRLISEKEDIKTLDEVAKEFESILTETTGLKSFEYNYIAAKNVCQENQEKIRKYCKDNNVTIDIDAALKNIVEIDSFCKGNKIQIDAFIKDNINRSKLQPNEKDELNEKVNSVIKLAENTVLCGAANPFTTIDQRGQQSYYPTQKIEKVEIQCKENIGGDFLHKETKYILTINLYDQGLIGYSGDINDIGIKELNAIMKGCFKQGSPLIQSEFQNSTDEGYLWIDDYEAFQFQFQSEDDLREFITNVSDKLKVIKSKKHLLGQSESQDKSKINDGVEEKGQDLGINFHDKQVQNSISKEDDIKIDRFLRRMIQSRKLTFAEIIQKELDYIEKGKAKSSEEEENTLTSNVYKIIEEKNFYQLKTEFIHWLNQNPSHKKDILIFGRHADTFGNNLYASYFQQCAEILNSCITQDDTVEFRITETNHGEKIINLIEELASKEGQKNIELDKTSKHTEEDSIAPQQAPDKTLVSPNDNKEKRVLAVSIDFDGCLGNKLFVERYQELLKQYETPEKIPQEAYEQAIVETNQVLFDSVKEMSKGYGKVIIMVGSNRTSAEKDQEDGIKNKNGSVFRAIEHFSNALQKSIPISVETNKRVAFDSVLGQRPGYNFDLKEKQTLDDSVRGRYLMSGDMKFRLAYFQIHDVCANNPDSDVTYVHADDRDDIVTVSANTYGSEGKNKEIGAMLPSNLKKASFLHYEEYNPIAELVRIQRDLSVRLENKIPSTEDYIHLTKERIKFAVEIISQDMEMLVDLSKNQQLDDKTQNEIKKAEKILNNLPQLLTRLDQIQTTDGLDTLCKEINGVLNSNVRHENLTLPPEVSEAYEAQRKISYQQRVTEFGTFDRRDPVGYTIPMEQYDSLTTRCFSDDYPKTSNPLSILEQITEDSRYELQKSILYKEINQLNKPINTHEQLKETLRKAQKIESEIDQMGGDADSYWIRLDSVIDHIIPSIESQTSSAYRKEINRAQEELDKQYDNDTRAAQSYSGEVVVEYPDPRSPQYILSDEQKHAILSRYQNTTAADQLVTSNEFEELKILRNKIKSKARESRFNIACSKLEGAANTSEFEEMKLAGNNLLTTIKEAINKGDIKDNDLPRITGYLNDTTDLIKKFNNNENYDHVYNKHNNNIKDAKGRNRPWGPIVGGALLCIAGVLLVAAAITVTVLTFGVSSPLTLPTAAVGGALTAAGIAMTTGAAVGLAATAITGTVVASKAGMFAYNAAKGPIATSMEGVSSSIEKMKAMKTTLSNFRNEDEEEARKTLDVSDSTGFCC